jgi:alkylresorcinol/alkylpyrone synthase
MPRIVSTATAVPPYRVDQQETERFARQHFAGHVPDLDRLVQVFSNAGIDARYFTRPLDWLGEPRSLAEKNDAYIEGATAICAEAVSRLLAENGLEPGDIDYLVHVNSTGLATPSIDARLLNVLPFRRDTRRCPIWGLGCAGGAAGLAHAYHHAVGHPRERVVLVAAELCGLTFMAEDYSRSNLVATALFGEGAAAVLVAGDEVPATRPAAGGAGAAPALELFGTRSWFYPDSLDVMGWNVVSEGLQVVFAQRIPEIVAEHSARDLDGFLRMYNLSRDDVSAYLFHPGGRKVIEAYEAALGFKGGELALSREILREYGNMSSGTMLFVLDRYLRTVERREGHVVMSALGPGFCSESLLARW